MRARSWFTSRRASLPSGSEQGCLRQYASIDLDDIERVARSYGQSAALEDAGKIVVYITSSEPAERIRTGLLAAIRIYPSLLRVVQVPELPLLDRKSTR